MMIDIEGDPNCEHEWEEYDDPAAYNDGFNCPSIEICTRCNAQRHIVYDKKNSNDLKWYEYFTLIPFMMVVILYLITIAPIITLIMWVKEDILKKF